jgi:hypothetical protein
MRNQGVVDLGENRTVVVQELRVRDGRLLMASAALIEQMTLVELLTNRFSEIVNLLDDSLQLPAGETLDDLTFSEVDQVKERWLEVNRSFLDLMGLAPGLAPASPKNQDSPSSTEPVSS